MPLVTEFIRRILKRFLFFLADTGAAIHRKKIIVFVVHNNTMFDYCRSIYLRLKHDGRLRLYFYFPRPERFKNNDLETLISDYDLQAIGPFIYKLLKWNLALYPDHSDWTRGSKVYIGHGITAGKLVCEKLYAAAPLAFDNLGNFRYTKLFLTTDFEKSFLVESLPELEGIVRVVGSPLLNELEECVSRRTSMLERIDLTPSRQTIFITSTWGPDSTIQKFGPDLMNWIPRLAETYNVVVSIHENNYEEKYSAIDWEDRLSSLQDGENVYIISNGASPFEYLSTADLLITDMTSLGLYFLKLLRPIITVDIGPQLFERGAPAVEISKKSIHIRDFSNIENDIKYAFSSFDYQAMYEYSRDFFGCSERSWVDYENEIYDCLAIPAPGDLENL